MISVEVYINGVRVADTADSLDERPTALDNLHIRWGRDNILAQPAAAELSLTLDCPPDSDLPELTPGDIIEVKAAGAAAYQRVNVERDWQNYITLDRSLISGSRSALEVGANESKTLIIQAPGVIQSTNSNPDAWDEILKITTVTDVDFKAKVDLPAGWTVSLIPIWFSAPWKDSHVKGTPIATATTAAAAAALSGSAPPPNPDCWPAIGLEFTAPARAWENMRGNWRETNGNWNSSEHATVYPSSFSALANYAKSYVTPFYGRISEIRAIADNPNPRVEVNAVDLIADLDAIHVGDDPWPMESFASRFNHIKEKIHSDYKTLIPKSINDVTIQARDVDNQSALELFRSLAHSTGSVFGTAYHSVLGAYLYFENLQDRKPLYVLSLEDGQIQTETNVNAVDGATLSASILKNRVELVKSFHDSASSVEVSYKIQEGDEIKDAAVIVTDEALKAKIGPRLIQIDTELTSESDARALAHRILSRTDGTGWQINNIEWDTADYVATRDLQESNILRLIDSTQRVGLPVILTDLPEWLPGDNIPLYSDGGSLSFSGGRWHVSPILTRAAQAASSTKWSEIPSSWDWRNGAGITWNILSLSTLKG